ncbi:MAG: hypothetical protein AAB573_05530 [Patescibacteria group bacterium]
MNAVRDLILFILFLIMLGVVWVYSGGAERSIARGGALLEPPAPLGGGRAYDVPSVALRPRTAPDDDDDTNPSGWGPSVVTTFTNFLGTFSEESSPYAKYVTLERGRADSDLAGEYVIIRVSKSAPSKVTVSDWRIESTQQNIGVSLGSGTELPSANQVNIEGPITVNPGAVLYVSTRRSEVGVSFRTNICTGYFEQFQNFTPSLKLECPRADDEAERLINVAGLPDMCRDEIDKLGRCIYHINALPGAIGALCQDFLLTKMTYVGCVNQHRNDPGFYKDEWRLYLRRDQQLWKSKYERIRLVDENKKVIDVVSY